MSSRKILYICQEITPYLPESDMSELCRRLSQGMQEQGYDIRTFMPKYGVINERRNQLHEVIRLSGMNLIINDNDHQLIIKVASIPSARVQVYFIDNEDYFGRKNVLTDDEGAYFEDNDERAIFFARGALETVKKLRWNPDIIHCHGWFSSVAPLYLRNTFADDPVFKKVKIVVSLYNDAYPGALNSAIIEKIKTLNGGKKDNTEVINEPSYINLMKHVIDHADGVTVETKELDPEIEKYLKESKKPVLEYQDRASEKFIENYQRFYEEL